MTREVVETVAEYDCLARQIHLPLQSGDDEVLKRMNRNHGLADYRKSVDYIRALIPEATLFTDIIVGFPGETEEQFERTRRAMLEFNYNMAYIAMYSPRPGARSADWDDDVPDEEKKRRLHVLSGELRSMSKSHNEGLIGKTVRVLVYGHDRKRGYLSGKTEGLIIVRFPSDDDSLIGRFVDVKISSAADLSVEGALVGEKTAAPAQNLV
jgi:tRNA-2-methylthio-N6-dimethylallyladenosine synthase